MPVRSRPLTAVAVLALGLLAASSPGVAGAAGADPRKPRRGFSAEGLPPPAEPGEPPPLQVLVVSGGISLGSYEAGANWAALRLLKLDGVRLAAAAGASAGNINAFLAAATWCQSDAADAAEAPADNLFWKAWIPVGWEHLFPGERSCADYSAAYPELGATCARGEPAYLEDDGLLTRRAFGAIRTELSARFAEPRYREGCRVLVGSTLTRSEALVERDPLLDLSLSSQSAYVAVATEVTDGRLGFRLLEQEPADTGYVRLRRKLPGRDLLVQDVLAAIEASSAFPVAFGPRAVPHCVKGDGPRKEVWGASCPEGWHDETGPFVDGGVFDNLPVALAMDLAARSVGKETWIPEGAAARFSTVDPDYRRPPGQEPPAERVRSRSLEFYLYVMRDLVGVARQHELATFSRFARQMEKSPGSGTARFVVASRFHPVFGEHLGNFAAFLSRPFREHDFHVGVYDALFEHARQACAGRDAGVDFGSCILLGVRQAHDAIVCPGGACTGRAGAPEASHVVRRLAAAELAASYEAGDVAQVRAARASPDAPTVGEWLDAAPSPSPVVAALLRATLQLDAVLRPDLHRELEVTDEDRRAADDDRFGLLLQLLRRTGGAGALPASDRRMVEEHDLWVRDQVLLVARRLVTIEKEERRPGFAQAAGVVEHLLDTNASLRREGLQLDPSSIPERHATWARGLPDVLAFDPGHGGVFVAWQPRWGFSRYGAAGLQLGAEWLWAGPLERTQAFVGFPVVLRPGGWLGVPFSAVHVAPQLVVEGPFGDGSRRHAGDLAWGGEAAVDLFGKLRFGLGVRSELPADREPGPFVAATIGVADLDGLLWWSWRAATE